METGFIRSLCHIDKKTTAGSKSGGICKKDTIFGIAVVKHP
jgi:hypothetical protein